MSSSGRYIVPLLFFSVTTYFLYQVHHVLLPFVLGGTLAYLLNPMVTFFEVRGIRHRVAVLLVFTAFMLVLISVLYVTITVATQEAARIGTDWPRFVARFNVLSQMGHSLIQRFPFIQSWLNAHASGTGGKDQFLQKAPTAALHVLPVFELSLLVPFLALFFMLDGVSVRNAALELVPPRYVEMLLSVVVEIDNSLGNYLRGLCLQAMFLGILAGVGFSLIGLHYSLQIAVWVAATSMIPLVGPLSAGAAGCLVALVQWGTLSGIIKVIAISVGIRLLDDWLLHPMILRKAVHIHPAVTVFSLMAGASLFGFWGLLFAVPIVCMVKVLFEVIWDWYRSEYGLHHDSLPVEILHIPLI